MVDAVEFRGRFRFFAQIPGFVRRSLRPIRQLVGVDSRFEVRVFFLIRGEMLIETLEQIEPAALLFSANKSEEHTSELQLPDHLVCRLLLEKKKILSPSNPTSLITLH